MSTQCFSDCLTTSRTTETKQSALGFERMLTRFPLESLRRENPLNRSYSMKKVTSILILLFTIGSSSAPAFAGFNADAPKPVRRIFTQLAFAEGRLVTYHVLEPGPQSIQAFPTGHNEGMLLRFPGCPALRPVLDDSAAPSTQSNLVPDLAMRKVFNVSLSRCDIQPTSV